jgi:HEAT repeat protein
VAREWTSKTYVEKLVAALGHPEPTTPLRAAWILGELRAASAVPLLMDVAEGSHDLFVRAAAVSALGRIGDPRALELLRRLGETGPVVLRPIATSAVNRIETMDEATSQSTKEGSA